MADSKGSLDNLQGFGEKQWFFRVWMGLVIVIVVYIILHFFLDKYKFEYAKLDEKEVQQVNKIYFPEKVVTLSTAVDTPALKKKTSSKPDSSATAAADTIKKNEKKDTALPQQPTAKAGKSQTDTIVISTDTIAKFERAITYLTTRYSLDPEQLNNVRKYLSSAKDLEATAFLADLKLSVESYFWLKSPASYLEVIFWTIFGVLCSVLFSLGVVSKKSTNNPTDPTTYFDNTEIPSQVAKLFYAPLCTITIVFGYNFFTGQSLADISASKGVIVFAFIGGFYSERLIAFLDKLKDVLLPNSGKADVPVTKQAALKNIVIRLLEPPAAAPPLFAANLDFKSAGVILTFTETNETIAAKNIDKSEPLLFIADFIKPGNYTIAVTASVKNLAGNDVALTGTLAFQMKTDDLFVTIQLK